MAIPPTSSSLDQTDRNTDQSTLQLHFSSFSITSQLKVQHTKADKRVSRGRFKAAVQEEVISDSSQHTLQYGYVYCILFGL